MNVLDLFCGAGGLALGFHKAGFNVTGVDINPAALQTFTFNHIGTIIHADLGQKLITGDFHVIIGGPPCRPWSTVNTTKRGRAHQDYRLIERFFLHVKHNMPKCFLMENVPALANDTIFKDCVRRIHALGYSVAYKIISYADFGASTRRRRLIVVGTRAGDASLFFAELTKYRRPPVTVRDVIWWLKDIPWGGFPDHIWPCLRTVDRYREYYTTGKFGWYVLRWDEPAPSFGNIMKTYILHPDSFNGSGGTARVISVREALCIMGFDSRFRFPHGTGMSVRYQMVADAVSPVFSYAAAQAILEALNET